MEGVTDAVFRRNHLRFFPGVARYYTPFISPTQNHVFTPRDKRELAPENNPEVPLVPQLLGRNSADLLWAIRELSEMGYREINLNLGCPSGTVTAKGAGLLKDHETLRFLLEELFSASPIKISVKTRLGMRKPEEFLTILPILEQFPIERLIIHPRTAADMYTGEIHLDMFRWTAQNTSLSLAYNGDITSSGDVDAVATRFPSVVSCMIGRAFVANPGLFCCDEAPDQLLAFHDALCAEYPVVFGSENSALHRMKAILSYRVEILPDAARLKKCLQKTKRWRDYIALADELLRLRPMRELTATCNRPLEL